MQESNLTLWENRVGILWTAEAWWYVLQPLEVVTSEIGEENEVWFCFVDHVLHSLIVIYLENFREIQYRNL